MRLRSRQAWLALALLSALLLAAAPQPRSARVRVFEIQGAAHVSPLAGRLVEGVPGIVTAVRNNGFSLQDAEGDGRPDTSDAVFVFTRSAAAVSVGDSVLVSGQIREFRPGDDENNLSVTEIVGPTVSVVASGQPLPSPVLLGPRGRSAPAQVVAEGVSGDVEQAGLYAPDASTLDFFESLEGMRVQIDDAIVVGPRGGPGELPVLPDEGTGVPRRTVRGGLLAPPPGEAAPSLVLVDGAVRVPPASVGDRLPGQTVGIVDYAFGGYRIRTETLPSLILGGIGPEAASNEPMTDPSVLAVATFNVENVSPRERPAKLTRLAETVVTRLAAPDLVVVQEIQDDSGAADDGTVGAGRTGRVLTDAILAAGGPAYTYREIAPENNLDGGEPGANIRIGVLVRADRGLAFVERPGGDAVTPVAVVPDADGPHLSISPGRVAPASPAWTESRKPLAAELTFNGRRLFVVGCHFASKRGSQPRLGRFQPPGSPTDTRRQAQAREVHAFAAELLAADPQALLLVLGDLNDTPDSETLAHLTGGLLADLITTLPEDEQYSYVFGGQAEAIDHILASPALLGTVLDVDVVHGNAEIVGAPSDHDPMLVRFRLTPP